MRNYDWSNSKCKGLWLHRFEIAEQFNDAVVERCAICGKQKAFAVRDGRVNNLEYIAFHIRQVLVPQHNLYNHEYGLKI